MFLHANLLLYTNAVLIYTDQVGMNVLSFIFIFATAEASPPRASRLTLYHWPR